MDIGTLENARKLKILEGEQQVSGGWNLAREPNMEDSPYRLFKAPRYPDDDIEDYRGQPAFGVEEGGQMFFTFPFVQNFDDSPDMKRQKNMLEGDALKEDTQNPETNDMMIASASDIGQQVLQQRAAESKAGKIHRGSRSYIGEDHQRAREIDGEIYWYDEYKHMPFYQKILQKYGHTEELQQIRNEISQ